MDSVGQEQGQNRCVPADFVCVPIKVLHIYISISVFTSVSVIKYLLNSGRLDHLFKGEMLFVFLICKHDDPRPAGPYFYPEN